MRAVLPEPATARAVPPGLDPDSNQEQETSASPGGWPWLADFPSSINDDVVPSLNLNDHLIRNPESTFLVRVTGEALADAGLHDGDLLVMDRATPPLAGNLVLAVVEGVAVLARLGRDAQDRLIVQMVPIVERPQGLRLLFTQRASQLKNHPGQISFPGGRIEAGDPGPWEAALRETEEEIGLSRRHVALVGYLHDHLVISGYIVTPVVTFVAPDFELTLDPTEVDEVFEVPLLHVLDRGNHVMQTRQYFGHAFVSYDIPYQGRNIWGATAGMLMSLCRVLEEH